jgi:hypothetical protein
MSIEQKIAEILAESKAAALEQQVADTQETVVEEVEEVAEEAVKPTTPPANPDNARNNVDTEKAAEGGTSKTKNKVNQDEEAAEASHLPIKGVKEDIDALMNGEELSEEFRVKATTIYEAAVTTRVKAEVARIEEEYATKLEEEVAGIAEGLVEKVDGYLDYVVEQWIAQNELALEHGMKSEILEGFVAGLKGLFEEHYIDIPEEKFDVVGVMESTIEELETKLNEQVAANVELNKTVGEMKRSEIVEAACEGLSDTEVEKFKGLAEELAYEDVETFTTKVQTIRESYFTTKAQADVTSVVTDTPVETLVEEKKIDPTMAQYLAAINQLKK